MERIDNPSFDADRKTIATVSRLMTTAVEIHASEDAAFSKLRPLLSELLGAEVGVLQSKGSRAPDGLVHKRIGECYIPLLCVEYKRSVGEGGCDPSVQAAYSVREFLVLDQVRVFWFLCATIDAVPVQAHPREVLLPLVPPLWQRCLPVHTWRHFPLQVHRSAAH